ncbi:hypothetical protein PC129_g1879 [Phytophthora cactorum]|uniref:Uncharacterized protein n=1 Tax=Phytophthora cactorum TaxID=29920 RepID=A0A329SQD2_9STRA|nr:hypothetical protein Pcac1_g27674 [Phytophthora cactorum]KAG2825930.1 hypothetical protein PC112_g9478 [Phytophthora cactorum]KAG2829548.1 hypothetical protein PC111_g7720 [Phytophthora cactorum]KAG2865641.1 hypothetical protein PC113_g3523 [Phytophthora cactorum]KAG2926255.1 hypothetical protein PC114_g3851 [Phytophthora cactorum]
MGTPPGMNEAVITLHNEQWTAEGARLLLEVDEGWVGYRDDFAWSWHDETYAVYAAICQERGWVCNSLEASVAMLQALRTGEVSMKLSDSTHSSDGYTQWTLTEMRVLGTLMRDVVDGKSLTVRWSAQLAAFVDAMKARDGKYAFDDRTVEDFAFRAGKFVPEAILLLIDEKRTNGKATPKTAWTARRTRRASASEPRNRTRRVIRNQSTENYVDSEDEPLARFKKSRTRATRTAASAPPIQRIGRKRTLDSEGDSSYHDPTSEDEDLLWADESSQRVSEGSAPATQEITSQGELLPAADNDQPNALIQDLADQGLPSLSQDDTIERPSSATNQSRDSPRDDPSASSQASPREEDIALQRPSLPQDEPEQQRAFPRQETADQAQLTHGAQNDTPTRRPARKHQRVQESVVRDRIDSNGNPKSDAPHLFRSLNPYDRPAKPWGEFVVEVLLAERTARNEDELDYVRFVRGLYEI